MEIIDGIKPSLLNKQKRRNKRLHEELIECRRGNGGDKNKSTRNRGEKKRIQTLSLKESLPQRESYRAKRNTTYQCDNLEPLIRFLNSHCGQKWNKVFSKLSKQLDTRSTLGLHVLDHLWDFVIINTKLDNKGHIILYSRYGRLIRFFHRTQFYVDPTTGILHILAKIPSKGPFPKKARWKKQKEKEKIKRKLGIQKSRPEIFNIDQVNTYTKRLRKAQHYDLIALGIKCRIKLISIKKGNFGLTLNVEILKSSSKNLFKGKQITLFERSKPIDRSFYYSTPRITKWNIFDVGTFTFKKVRYEKNNYFLG